MKKTTITLGLLLASAGMMAQTVYTNADLSSTSDVIGTARYVGMGGALGALGADISAISSNPAAIGMYRRSDIALTAGGMWQKDRSYQERNSGRGTFDQMGFVAAFRIDHPKVRFVNFSFNYQKRNNLGGAYYADNGNLNGLSQADQFASLANSYYDEKSSPYTLYGAAYDAYLYERDEKGFYNPYGAQKNRSSFYTRGGVQAFDVNFSTNIEDRYYVGLTIGASNVNYDRFTSYTEERNGSGGYIQDYTIDTDRHISGSGINVKAGTIIRPIEDNPFRVGLAVETPTWYNLKTSAVWDIWSKQYYDSELKQDMYLEEGYFKHASLDDNFLEYRLRTPWRARVSMGSTIDRYFAWGVEYEYANYGKNNMRYPNVEEDYWGWEEYSGSTPDREMNKMNKQVLQGQHTVKLGFELNATDNLALRFGYNYVSSMFKDNARLSQHIDSYAMDYVSETSYMNLSDVNLITCGLGYRFKRFYIDMAYRFRQQDGKYFAFDDSFTQDSDFMQDNPSLAGATLQPVNVNLNRHVFTCTLGVKF